MYESHFLEISFVHLMIGLDFFFINENTAAKATNIFKKFKRNFQHDLQTSKEAILCSFRTCITAHEF